MGTELKEQNLRTYDDEIDLIELIASLWRGRVQVLVVMFIALLVAVGYLLVKPSEYIVEAQVSHPNSLELAELVVLTLEPGDDLSESAKSFYSPEEVFVTAQRELASRGTQREFVLSVNESMNGADKPLNFESFSKGLKVVPQKAGKAVTGLLFVQLRCSDEERCAGLVNDYVDFVHDKVREALVADMLSLLSSEAQRAEEAISHIRKNHKLAIDDDLKRLDGMIEVARAMGWAEPNSSVLASDKVMPRYYEGYRVLEGDRARLAAQLDDEAFVAGLRSKQRSLRLIESGVSRIAEVKTKVSVLDVVDYAYPTGKPVAPNKKLVVILALMLGGLVGVVSVFVRYGIESYRSKKTVVG